MSVEENMRVVRAEIAALRKANPRLRFVQAWEALKKKQPALFAESAPATEPVNTRRSADDASYYQRSVIYGLSGEDAKPYIELRAEDARELERQVNAGLWD